MYLCKPESFFMNQQYYDKTSPKSIFEYAIPLLDHTLRKMVGDKAVEGYLFIFPSSTIRLHVFPRTQIQSTKYSHPNLWNPHRGFSLTNTRANELNVIYHQGNDNIVVQRLVHFSKLRASAPS